jgi:hypothetical protein
MNLIVSMGCNVIVYISKKYISNILDTLNKYSTDILGKYRTRKYSIQNPLFLI